MSLCFFCEKPEPCGCPAAEEPEPIETPFPAEYIPNFLTKDEADELCNHFVNFDARHLPNPYNDTLLNTRSLSYAANPTHSQCYGGYQDPSKPKNKALAEEEEHCAGLVLPSSQAPDCIRKLRVKLNNYLHSMPQYAKHQINYLSVMCYPDENAGIGWHKHDEDNGCDTPVLLVSTGSERDFYIGEINKSKPKAPDVFWRHPAENGSLIVMPDAMNYTHWHAILKNTPANQKKYSVPNCHYGPRVSINTKCLRPPRVFSIKSRCFPRWAVYVGCKYGRYEGTIYGNDHEPFKGHFKPIAKDDDTFRLYVEKRMLDSQFRAQAIKELRGKHLLCWCIQDGPERTPFCHARVWLGIVNRAEYGENGGK